MAYAYYLRRRERAAYRIQLQIATVAARGKDGAYEKLLKELEED